MKIAKVLELLNLIRSDKESKLDMEDALELIRESYKAETEDREEMTEEMDEAALVAKLDTRGESRAEDIDKSMPELMKALETKLAAANVTLAAEDFRKLHKVEKIEEIDKLIETFVAKYPGMVKTSNSKPLTEGLNPAQVVTTKDLTTMTPDELYAYAKSQVRRK